jgi:hypothetical protein
MGHDPGVVGLQFQRATRANGHLHHLARRRLVVDATEEVPFFVARATASQAVPERVDDVMEKSVTDSGFAKKRVLVRKSTNQQLARATIPERTDYQLFHYRDRFVAGVVLGMSDTGYQFTDRLCGLRAADLW